jgi:hypothetical protein
LLVGEYERERHHRTSYLSSISTNPQRILSWSASSLSTNASFCASNIFTSTLSNVIVLLLIVSPYLFLLWMLPKVCSKALM